MDKGLNGHFSKEYIKSVNIIQDSKSYHNEILLYTHWYGYNPISLLRRKYWRVRNVEPSYNARKDVKWQSHLGTVWESLQKLIIYCSILSFNSLIFSFYINTYLIYIQCVFHIRIWNAKIYFYTWMCLWMYKVIAKWE